MGDLLNSVRAAPAVRPRDRRALIVGGVALLGCWVALRLLPAALRTEAKLRDRVAHQTASLERFRTDLESLPALEDSGAAIKRRLVVLAPRLLGGTSANEATAELSVILRRQLEALHARVERIVVTPDSVVDSALKRISARVELETDSIGLEQILGHFANADPLLVVDALQVATAEPPAAGASVERLRVSLHVWGWWLARGPITPDTVSAGRS